MSEYGYLNHTSTDRRDEEAISAVFSVLPCESVTVEQLWSPGEKRRPAFDALVERLGPDDTLYVHSIDRLGADASEVVRVWKNVTQKKGASIVVLNDPSLCGGPSLQQVKQSALSAFDGVKQTMETNACPYSAFRLVEAQSG